MNDITDNLIKKYCFGGFSFINPNLPIELRDIMVKISTHSLSSNSVSQGNSIVHKETLSHIIVESIKNLFSYHLWLIYKNTIDYCTLTFYLVTLLTSLIIPISSVDGLSISMIF